MNHEYGKGKLHTTANSFRPKPKPTYEAEPVKLGPPPATHYGEFSLTKIPRDVVGEYKRRNTKSRFKGSR